MNPCCVTNEIRRCCKELQTPEKSLCLHTVRERAAACAIVFVHVVLHGCAGCIAKNPVRCHSPRLGIAMTD